MLQSKGGMKGHWKSIGDRFRRREKAKLSRWGALWDGKMIDTDFFYTGGYRIVRNQQLTP